MFGDWKAHARIDALTRRVATLEALVERLAGASGLPASELEELRDASDHGLTAEVRRLVGEGQKIKAIKEYRTVTGAGLIEAKQAVDEYEARGRW
ncbi:ribosomal protein L7/L12 [Brevibacterium yomogidense]|uniref:Large ribosomal subunit protein bL12 C-terminal domain-containing protein n=1 Tax=Brevibacterium yomogidense TaxID=946573 RepID=A0A1X6XIJ3_9MICO|nr:ribosomal protein L7/L12 [Brevibacterium yomogidense]SLM99115.1 hypothetical protein FM105_10295 [Brevibacterium yomogidense]